MRGTEVPVTPSVLEWAIQESGYSVEEVARKLGTSTDVLVGWLDGRGRPKLTKFRKLASILRRPAATFLLSEPPEQEPLEVKFRPPPNTERRQLNAKERRFLREAVRVQGTVRWLLEQMGEARAPVPEVAASAEPGQVAAAARQHLGVSIDDQLGSWKTEYQAQAAWREALEASGVSVLMLRMGEGSCRGFSIWDDYVPMVAVNSHFRATARVFSMLHEYGHLLTRSSSACLESAHGGRLAATADPIERWCEAFAAAVLLPDGAVRQVAATELGHRGRAIADLADAGRVAGRFKVSLRATVIRLIELGVSTWDLYRRIPSNSDSKPSGGGGGGGLTRAELREKEFGRRLEALFVRGMRDDLISRGDVLSHLRVSEDDLEDLEKAVRG